MTISAGLLGSSSIENRIIVSLFPQIYFYLGIHPPGNSSPQKAQLSNSNFSRPIREIALAQQASLAMP
jgi:hypothetical protein